jgi:hypothetical protein
MSSSSVVTGAHLEKLFGPEIEGILARERRSLQQGLRGGNGAALATGLGVGSAPKVTRSGGA